MRAMAAALVLVLPVAIVLAMTAGCSHEALDSGTQGLTVKYVPSPSGAGRYDQASFTIVTISVIPADPEAAALYDNKPLLFRFSGFPADMTGDKPIVYSNIALTAGVYNVALIELTAPQLIDQNVSTTPATCIEGVAAVPSGPAASQVPQKFSFPNPPSLTFTVRPGQTKLSLTVNIPGLIEGFEDAFTCQADCGAGRPCLTSFDPASYADTLLANVTLQ